MDTEKKKLLEEKILLELINKEQEQTQLKKVNELLLPEHPAGRLSSADAEDEKSIKEAHLRYVNLRINKLKAALSKLDEESFGNCVVCGEEISDARLLARPDHSRCVSCSRLPAH